MFNETLRFAQGMFAYVCAGPLAKELGMTGSGHDISRRTARWKPAAAGVVFACVMGLALFVRLYRIGEEGFHWDEALTLRAFFGLYQNGFADAFRESRAIDPPMTPVYFVLQYAWGWTAGFTMLSMHLLSVLFSAATFVAVFLVGRKLRGTWTGLWAMFLLAASPIHVYYSLEIRNYSLTALLGVLSLLTLLRAVENPTRSSWAVNFAVDVLLAMSHLFANLLFVPQAIFLLVCHRRRAVLLPWGISHVVVAAVVAAWLGTCDFTAMRNSLTGADIPPLSWEGGYDMLTALTGASYTWVGPMIGRAGVAGAIVAALFLFGLLAILAQWFVPRRSFRGETGSPGPFGADRGVLLLILAVIVPPALLAVITAIHSHCFYPRYAICSAVAAPILLACAVTMLRSATIRIVLAAALIVVNVSLLDQTLRNRPQRWSWTPILRFLAEGVKQEDYFVIFSSSPGGFSSMIEMLLPVTPKKTLRRQAWSPQNFAELAAWHERGIQAWCVTDIEEGPNAEFETMLDAQHLRFSKHVFKFGCYVAYRIPPGASTFAVRGDLETCVPLRSSRLRGWFAVDLEYGGGGVGMTHLASAGHPYAPIFTQPSLCLKSVTDGRLGEEWQAWDALRSEPGEVRLPSAACIDTRWPINVAGNRLACRLRHVFTEENAVDMLFEAAPFAAGNGWGPLVFTWVSSVCCACAPTIHFPGARDGVEGWVSFGASPSERGSVAFKGLSEEERERAPAVQGCSLVQGVHFSEPFYYGLLDGDQNEATNDDVMAFILMFEHPEDTRFALRDCAKDSLAVEWDWQYVFRAPEAGKTFSQRARMVYKPFVGQDDVLQEYRAWRNSLSSTDASEWDALSYDAGSGLFSKDGNKGVDGQ